MKGWIPFALLVLVSGCASGPRPAKVEARLQEIGFDTCPLTMSYRNTHDTPPRVLKRVTPRYPERARKKGIHGPVYMALVVGADGTVVRARVLCGQADLAAATVTATLMMTFKPATRAGKPVEAAIPFKYIFFLD